MTRQAKIAKAAPSGKKTDDERVPLIRLKPLFLSVPGIMGYSHLLKPDEAFGKTQFKLDLHMNDRQQEAFADLLQEKVIDAAFDDLLEDAGPKKAPKIKKGDAKKWLAEKMKQPAEQLHDLTTDPYFQFSCNHVFKNKDGGEERVKLVAWGGDKNLLDLGALRLTKGTVAKVGFKASLWAGGMSKGIAVPSLRLVGLQVLKKVSYAAGTGGRLNEDVTDDDLALLDNNFEMEDLSDFMAAPAKAKEAQKATAPSEFDDEIPF